MHTTNYHDTFITVSEDTAATAGTPPPVRDKPTVASRTFELIAGAPYEHTSDDVIFAVFADRNEIPPARRDAAREQFFSKGQACLRASDLSKRYGWGTHHDADGRVALYGMETAEYARLAAGRTLDGSSAVAVKHAMRSRR